MVPRLPLLRARPVRALAALALAATGLTCRESLTGPSLPVQTSFAVAPQFQAARGGPVILLSRVRVTLGALPSGTPVVADETRSFGTASSVAFDLTIPVSGESQRFLLRIAGIDAQGDTIYRKVDTVTVTAGAEEPEPLPVLLEYAGPDTVIRSIAIAPRDTTLDVGDSLLMRAQALDAQQAPVPQFTVGWTSGDPTIVSVERMSGRIRALRAGTVWMYGATFNGRIDSTRVTAFMPVARVAITPDSVGAVPGDTISLSAQTFGLDDQPVLGRTVVWTALDTNVVVLGTTGRVLARSPGRGRIVATSEGRADTAKIDVGQPVPTTLDVAGDSAVVTRTRTLALTATVRDGHGAVLPNAPRSWTSRRPSVVSVDTGGVVRALVADSSAWVVAQSGTARDSILIRVARLGVAVVGVVPSPATMTVGSTLQLTATPRDSAGQPNVDHPIAWASGDTLKARVSPTGVVTARDSGTVVVTATSGGVSGGTTITLQLVRVASVTASPDTARTIPGDSVPVSVVARDSANNVLTGRLATWRVADSTIAVRLASGFVRGMRQGTTQLVATVEGLSDTIVVVVGAPPVVITHVTVEPSADTLASLGDTLALVATAWFDADPTPATFTWASRDTNVVRVDGAGRVVSRANGAAWVVATAGGHSDSAHVVVRQELASATVVPALATVNLGSQLVLTVDARDARNGLIASPAVSYRSRSQGTIVGFDSTSFAQARAYVRGLALGTDTIDVEYPGGGNGRVVASAIVTVRSGISSIAVTLSSDTARAAGQRVTAVAIARDSAGGTMPGITFAFALSDTSVARIDSTYPDRVVLLARANGVASIVASAQGVSSPPAQLVVSRAITSVVVTPPSLTMSVGGTHPFLAEARDAGGSAIAGVAFAWASDAPGVLSIDASGVAHALAAGTAHVTATAGGVQSAAATVTVSAPSIRFLFGDTIAIGAPGVFTIPVAIDVAPPEPMQVRFAINDTIATLDSTSLTFSPGTLQRSLRLTARRPGVVRLVAYQPTIPRDGETGPTPPPAYAPDTLFVVQQAGLHLAQSIELNVGDTLATQVLLPTPAPVGGVMVSFTYGTPGIVRVVGDSVFVAEGLLAAPVRVAGLAAGTTDVVPVSGGTSGIPSGATVTVAGFRISSDYWADSVLVIGQGQRERTSFRISLPQRASVPVRVSLATTTGAATVDSVIVVPAGQSSVFFTLHGTTLGRDTVVATAAGWLPARAAVVVGTPHLLLCCEGALPLGTEGAGATVILTDSLGIGHERDTPLTVSLVSRSPSVLGVAPSATINTGQVFTSAAFSLNAAGQAWVVASAPGHPADSALFTVTPPALQMGGTDYNGVLGVGQQIDQFPYVFTGAGVRAPLTVRARVTDTTIATVEDSTAVIATSGSYTNFRKVRGKRAGSTWLIVSADGYLPDSLPLRVGTPVIRLTTLDTVEVTMGTTGYLQLRSADSLGADRAVQDSTRFSMRLLDQGVVTLLDSAATIAAENGLAVPYPRVQPVAPGYARVVASAPGWLPDTVVVRVVPARVLISADTISLGLDQDNFGNAPLVTTNTGGGQGYLTFGVSSLDPAVAVAPSEVSFPAGNWAGLIVTARGVGTARFVVSGNGYQPDTLYAKVTRGSYRVWALDTLVDRGVEQELYVYVTDSTGEQTGRATVSHTFRVVSSDTTVLRVDSAFYHVPVGQSYRRGILRAVGTGSAFLTIIDSTGGYIPKVLPIVRVVQPRLTFNQDGYTLGMRQHLWQNEAQVCRPSADDVQLPVFLSSGATAVMQPSSNLAIPAGEHCVSFDIFGQSQPGLVNLTASAAGHQDAVVPVEVGKPTIGIYAYDLGWVGGPPSLGYVYAMDQHGISRLPTEAVTFTLGSDNPSAVTWWDGRQVPATITIPADSSYVPVQVRHVGLGTAVLTASDARSDAYAYGTGYSEPVTVVTPQLSIWTQPTVGIGQVHEDNWVQMPYPAPSDITVTLTSSDTTVLQAPTTVTIPAGQFYGTYPIIGKRAGQASLAATTAGAIGVVSEPVPVTLGRLSVYAPSFGNTNTTYRANITLTDSLGNADGLSVLESTTFSIASDNANVQIVSVDDDTVPRSDVTVPAGLNYFSFGIRTSGTPGTARITITHPNYRTTTHIVEVGTP